MAVLAPDIWYWDLQLLLRLAWHCKHRGVVCGCDARRLSRDAEDCIRRRWVEMDNEEYVAVYLQSVLGLAIAMIVFVRYWTFAVRSVRFSRRTRRGGGADWRR